MNTTPLVDVVMCLLVFFLIVGTLASDRLAGVELPETGVGAEGAEGAALMVNVVEQPGAEGWAGAGVRVNVEGEDVPTAAKLEEAVRGALAADEGAKVRIRASRGLAFGAVKRVMEACGRAGASEVELATEMGAGAGNGSGR